MFLPIYEGLSGKLETTILKPGRRSKNINAFAILSRIIKKIRNQWKFFPDNPGWLWAKTGLVVNTEIGTFL